MPSPKTETVTATPADYVPLDEPIRRGEQVIEGITLRKPRAGELRGIQLAQLMMLDVAALQALLPRVSTPTLTSHDVANLDPADLMAIGVKVQGFFMSKAERESLPA